MRPINLLPQESLEKVQARQRIARFVVYGILYLIVLGIITFIWQGRVGSAERRVEDETAINQQLERDVEALADARDLVARYDANVAIIDAALLNEVSWGRVLNDLARMLPDRVWLTTFAGATADTGDGSLGTVTVEGTAFDVPDVSAWLRSLDSDRFPSVDGTWVSGVNVGLIGEIEVVSFSSATSLTFNAASDRRSSRVPEVPR
ncbi:MAG: hypothetical protein HKN07_14815 [Acidimicrobiia bacterium]|nr:hypothetical protein [Acidimicrobiia bacterium]